MNLSEALRFSFQALKANRLRTFLTALGLIIGNASVILVVTISLASNAEGAEIVVTDTGCGIGAEHIPKVFDRFYQVDSSRSTEGTGLGLALVKSIADLHGGSVAIVSGLSRGTSITLKFPRSLGRSGT